MSKLVLRQLAVAVSKLVLRQWAVAVSKLVVRQCGGERVNNDCFILTGKDDVQIFSKNGLLIIIIMVHWLVNWLYCIDCIYFC